VWKPPREGQCSISSFAAGDIVTPQGVVRGDLASPRDDRRRGAAGASEADRVIDATDISSCRAHRPARPLHHVWIKPDGTRSSRGPSRSARGAARGTTTFIDFAYWRDGATARAAIETRTRTLVGKARAMGLPLMLHSEPPPAFSG